MTEMYRFRSIEQLLGPEFNELEQQTIYFASPQQLNDPMEGLRDIFWDGDKIVWTNLFKHYIFCLHNSYYWIQRFGDKCVFELDNHLDFLGRWNQPVTPRMGELFAEIWDGLLSEELVAKFIDNIANAKRKVQFEELVLYIETLHLRALTQIQQVYINNGLASNEGQPLDKKSPDGPSPLEDKYFELLKELEAIDQKFPEAVFVTSYRVRSERQFKHKYQIWKQFSGTVHTNIRYLIFDFVKEYVRRLDKLLWPEWYAACFTKSYNNSSLWGNYGDRHKGACLVFEADDTADSRTMALNQMVDVIPSNREEDTREIWKFEPMTFQDINYLEKPGPTDFFRRICALPEPELLQLWYTDSSGEVSEYAAHLQYDSQSENWIDTHREDYEKGITFKNRDWDHEQESRLILYGMFEGMGDRHQALGYRFSSLKGIIFGIRMSEEDKFKAIEIILNKCLENKRTEFKFFQAYYSPEHGDIRRHEMQFDFDNIMPALERDHR